MPSALASDNPLSAHFFRADSVLAGNSFGAASECSSLRRTWLAVPSSMSFGRGLSPLFRTGQGETPDGLVHFAAERLLEAFEGGWPGARIHRHLRRKRVRGKSNGAALAVPVQNNGRRTVRIGPENLGFRVCQRNLPGAAGDNLVPELEIEQPQVGRCRQPPLRGLENNPIRRFGRAWRLPAFAVNPLRFRPQGLDTQDTLARSRGVVAGEIE